MKIKQIAPSKLTAYAKNSRTHSDDQISKIRHSIAEFGFLNPVLISGDNTIVAGHGRVMAAEEMGLDQIPAIVVDHLTPDQIRAYVIADNRIAELGGWDNDVLMDEINALMGVDFDIDSIGIDDSFIDSLSSFADFEPTLAPQSSRSEVTEEQIDKRSDQMGEAYQERSGQNLAGVICPHCAEEFSIDLDAAKRNS